MEKIQLQTTKIRDHDIAKYFINMALKCPGVTLAEILSVKYTIG